MPVIETTTQVEIDFEVYCTCGNGMCSNTEVRESRQRGMPQLTIDPCEVCVGAAEKDAQDEIDALSSTIDELEAEIARLKADATVTS